MCRGPTRRTTAASNMPASSGVTIVIGVPVPTSACTTHRLPPPPPISPPRPCSASEMHGRSFSPTFCTCRAQGGGTRTWGVARCVGHRSPKACRGGGSAARTAQTRLHLDTPRALTLAIVAVVTGAVRSGIRSGMQAEAAAAQVELGRSEASQGVEPQDAVQIAAHAGAGDWVAVGWQWVGSGVAVGWQ